MPARRSAPETPGALLGFGYVKYWNQFLQLHPTSISLSRTRMVDVFPVDEAMKLSLLTREMTIFFLGLFMYVLVLEDFAPS